MEYQQVMHAGKAQDGRDGIVAITVFLHNSGPVHGTRGEGNGRGHMRLLWC